MLYVIPLIAIFAVVIGAMSAGFATPTESAALGALATMALAALYRVLTLARLRYAAARGLELVTVHAQQSSSAPLLERFGFRRLVEFPSFRGR